jgi:hypothetical protein
LGNKSQPKQKLFTVTKNGTRKKITVAAEAEKGCLRQLLQPIFFFK